jgi:hypothetical protein
MTTALDILRELQRPDQSMSFARRLVVESAVTLNGEVLSFDDEVELKPGDIVQVGKKHEWIRTETGWDRRERG